MEQEEDALEETFHMYSSLLMLSSPASMLRTPPPTAILAFDWSVAEPILMHFRPSRATTMEPRPSSRDMIIRARLAEM